MRKFDKVSARPCFSSKYCRVRAENVIKPLVFMYHEAMSIFLGFKNDLNVIHQFGESNSLIGLLTRYPMAMSFPPFRSGGGGGRGGVAAQAIRI